MRDLELRMGNGMAKVTTGARRCGKSFLLFGLFAERLRASGVDDAHIVGVALDDEANEHLLNPKELSAHLKELTPPDRRMCHLFLDELQFAITDEEIRGGRSPKVYGVLNGLLRRQDVDVYVTGSNSRFLSMACAQASADQAAPPSRGLITARRRRAMCRLPAFEGRDTVILNEAKRSGESPHLQALEARGGGDSSTPLAFARSAQNDAVGPFAFARSAQNDAVGPFAFARSAQNDGGATSA